MLPVSFPYTRYTVRRKQGGTQATKDNKSATGQVSRIFPSPFAHSSQSLRVLRFAAKWQSSLQR